MSSSDASPDAAGESAARLRGIFLMMAAFALFACLDATAKYLSAYYDTPLIVFARYALALIYSAGFLWWTGTLGQVRANKLPLQIVRGLFLVTGTLLNFTALRYLQLAETSSIMFSNPLWVCALSVPLLGEQVGPRRWFAVIVGFVGVMIIIRPGLEGFQWASVLSLIAALTTALYQITTRKVAAYDSSETTLIYTALVGAVAVSPAVPYSWGAEMPAGWPLLLVLLLGVFSGLGHQFLIAAHRLAPAPVLAPFVYSQIIWMVLIGYVVFNDLPDIWTMAGGATVVSSGLYLLYRERQLKRRATRAAAISGL